VAVQIDHVVLWVEDARRALAFYTEVVGLPPVRAEEFIAGAAPFPSVRVTEGSILDLVPAAGAALVRGFTGESKPTAAGQPQNHVCLAMDRAELDALAARLAAAGVTMHRLGERSFGARGTTTHWFYFQDPDGNVLEARHYEPG
jgi:glyoxylase I family protein